MLKTVDVLEKYGYFTRSENGFHKWEYKDDYFEIGAYTTETWWHNLSALPDFKTERYMKYITGEYCICVSGIYHTKRTLGMLEFHMPVEFESERSCLAWFFCYLRLKLKNEWDEYCRYKKPPVKLTRSDYLVLPQILEEKERRVEEILNLEKFFNALQFTISKEELSRLRNFINNNEKIEKLNDAKIYFDGDFVTWKAKDYKFAGSATGIEWPNSIVITYNHEWRLPKRLTRSAYKFTFCKEGMFIDGIFNQEIKVSGNTVGKADIFDAELLSRLLKLVFFYPRYDYEKYKKFDAVDFREWVLQEAGSAVEPYLECLTAMTAPYPFYDDIKVYKMETAINLFKKFPKDIETVDMYDAWEKIFSSEDDLVMFERVKAGWECWWNYKNG